MTRADLKHCGKIPDAREELNRSVREGRIESRHSINSLSSIKSSRATLGGRSYYFASSSVWKSIPHYVCLTQSLS